MTEREPETTLRPAAGIWPLVHAERAALAADLADLTGEQRAAPSLCAGLTVREVLAHLVAGASLNPLAEALEETGVRVTVAPLHGAVTHSADTPPSQRVGAVVHERLITRPSCRHRR